MGLGSTAKKLQRVADLAEDLLGRLNELRERVTRMEETVDDTNSRVAEIETELTAQRALIERIAEAEDIDPEAALSEATGETGDSSDPSVATDASDAGDSRA